MYIPKPMKKNNFPIDLTIDYHSHILPGCDHGSNNVETSLQQISMAQSAGIKTICATSHFYPHKESVSSFLKRRSDSFDQLCSALNQSAPKICLGAEVLICNGMDDLDGLSQLCLQGTNELLLEMPFYSWPESIWDTLYKLIDIDSIHIILAHADRYPATDIERLIDEGVDLQLNAESFTNPIKRRRYLSWIENGYVKYLGSDIHKLGPEYKYWVKAKRILDKNFNK